MILGFLGACSAGGEPPAPAGVGSGSTGSTSSSGGEPIVLVTTGSTGSAGSTPGDGTPELCDGLDNDSNGIVDDVDVGNDGVCDCLNIATIGSIGPWSDGGNIFATWLGSRSPAGVVPLADEVLTEELLRPFQVIVVLHVDTVSVTGNSGAVAPSHHAFTDAEVENFQGWVANGGGVMTTIGYSGWEEGEVVNVNRLLSGVGMGYSTASGDVSGDITRWEPHPLTAGG